MMTIEELLTSVTTEQQLESFLATLETLGVKARSWRAGGSLRTILRVVAATYAGFSVSIQAFARAGFLELATGGWLTLLADQVFDVQRIPATFATGVEQLTNAGGGVFVVAPGEFRVLGATGKAYVNVAAFTLNPSDVLDIDVRAVELGSASSAPAGTVTDLETALAGVGATNPAALVGSDEEKDPDLRARCRAKLGTISGKGPRGAYAYAVRSALRGDGSAVDVNRLRISPSSSTGVVTVYVASPAGPPLPSDLPFIQASIERWARPDSVTATAVGATALAVSRTLTIWARAQEGLTASDLAALVNASLIAMVAAYPIGGIPKPPATQGYLYADGLAGTAKSAHLAIYDVDGAGSDVAMSPGEVVTLSVTLDVRLVEVPT